MDDIGRFSLFLKPAQKGMKHQLFYRQSMPVKEPWIQGRHNRPHFTFINIHLLIYVMLDFPKRAGEQLFEGLKLHKKDKNPMPLIFKCYCLIAKK